MQIDWNKIFSCINNPTDRKMVEEVEFWRKKDSRNEEFYQRACNYYGNNPTRNESFSEEQLNILYARMQKAKQYRRKRMLWRKMSVAASAILLISVGAWWQYNHDSEKPKLVAVLNHRVSEVIVVTENGDQFTTKQLNAEVARQVSENKLEYSLSETLREKKDTTFEQKKIQTHTIVVPRGRTFELVLSDGTFVALGPASKLTYPIHFDSCAMREVTLQGEGYFEVTKSSNRFVVNTDRMKLQVYGTIFNVLARKDIPEEAVLLEGVVGITPKNSLHGGENVLHPGDKSSVDEAGNVTIDKTDLAEYTARRNGFLLFNGKSIKQIVQSLELYYDVHFIRENSLLEMQKYVFSIKRDASLREALDVIESVADVKFIIEGKEVKIIPK